MGVASTEDSGFSFPKNLSVWWNEETEYLLQRIERWAAYARGYNRLRSVRLSPGRMTMQDEPETRWSINQTTNRLVVEKNWSPTFRRPHKSAATSAAAEQTRLRCCALGNAGYNYKSNANLESNCLEAYSLDHSIYFKTIGEIRNELRPDNKNRDNNNGAATDDATMASSQSQQLPTTPIDCGDFLSSDFDDEDEDEEFYEFDEELRDQLECNELESPEGEVIQVCRSLMNEDEINNNIMMLGFSQKFASQASVSAQ